MIIVRKKEGESASSLIYRFTKRVQQTGVLKESKKRRFYTRGKSKLNRKLSAMHRVTKRQEIEHAKKWGLAG